MKPAILAMGRVVDQMAECACSIRVADNASHQGSVDWFRFWLQGYEDPDPTKADQYKHWRGLKKMQDENDAKQRPAKN